MSFLTLNVVCSIVVLIMWNLRGIVWKRSICVLHQNATVYSVALRCPSPLCFVSRLRMEEAGGTLWNHTDIYNLSNLPLLTTPAESPLLNYSHRRRSNMDTLVHLSSPSFCNTFHCLVPSVVCALSPWTPPSPCLSSLGSEKRTMSWFFLVGKLSVCKTARADYSSECRMMDWHETTH